MNKQIITHAFCSFLCLIGCGFFYMMGGGTSEVLAVEEQSVDINVIPDPIVTENESTSKSRMEMFEEYQSQQQRRDAEIKAEREFNSLSFFTGTSSEYEAQEETEPGTKVDLTPQEQIASLNNIGSNKGNSNQTTTIAHSSVNNIKEPLEEKKEESVEDQIARRKKETMREKKKRISLQTGIDITYQDQEKKEEVKVEPIAELPQRTASKKGFRTMGGSNTSTSKNTLHAVVNDEQTNITTASQVKLRITESITISGTTIPKNTMVYAKASFSANRMHLKTENIIFNGNIYPFDAVIYDRDGFEGLYVADNAVNDAAKETSSNTISGTSIGVTPAQRTLSNVITSTTSAIKNATSNKIRETKVTLPANYEVFIKQKK